VIFDVALSISTQFIIEYALLLFLALITYRTSIKVFFQYSRTIKKTKKNVLVYGAGELGIAVKRTFDHDLTSNRIIVGYLDDHQAKIGKSIDGVKIYDPIDLANTIHKLDIDEVIIATNQIAADKKSNLIDLCLEFNVHVLTLPPVSRIMGGELNS
jgi:FlaA1/EpsC-like NDP-sugar epimerase